MAWAFWGNVLAKLLAAPRRPKGLGGRKGDGSVKTPPASCPAPKPAVFADSIVAGFWLISTVWNNLILTRFAGVLVEKHVFKSPRSTVSEVISVFILLLSTFTLSYVLASLSSLGFFFLFFFSNLLK